MEAVERVNCGNFRAIPTCRMKLQPFPRFSRSSSMLIPSNEEGVRVSSSSVNIHCELLSDMTISSKLVSVVSGCALALAVFSCQ